MCGRYRLTRRRQLEIEQRYCVEEVNDLDIWERQFNRFGEPRTPQVDRRSLESPATLG